jgi:hypothetical protein
MSVTHRLTGYDRRSEALVFAHEIPRTKTNLARDAAGVPPQDVAAVGAYPLRPDQARRIAVAIGARINTERYEWFLEPTTAAAA